MNTLPPEPIADAPKQGGLKRLLWLIPLLIFIGLAVLLYRQLGRDPTVVNQAQVNRAVPAFRLPDLKTGTTRTQADLPKEPFILNVWGSWCPTCHVEHPQLLQLAQQVPLIGINYKDEQNDALAYLAKNQDPFQISIVDQAGTLGLDLGVTGAPESFIVDREQRIRLHFVGEITPAVIKDQLMPCIQALRQSDTRQAASACQQT